MRGRRTGGTSPGPSTAGRILDGLSEAETMRQHPRRGPLTGREILIVVARHAAEPTRDLMKAATGQCG
jgi:hypothetical protein